MKLVSYVDDDSIWLKKMKQCFDESMLPFELHTFTSYQQFTMSDLPFDFFIFDNDLGQGVMGEEIVATGDFKNNVLLFTGSCPTDLDGLFPIVSKTERDWKLLVTSLVSHRLNKY